MSMPMPTPGPGAGPQPDRPQSPTPADQPTVATSARSVGTLITVAPAPSTIGHLLRTAIDAEQVGATRLHLHPDQTDTDEVVASLREHTGLVLTADRPLPGIDRIGSSFTEVVLDECQDSAALLTELAGIATAHSTGASVSGRGASAMPVLLVALAAGLHIRVGTADTPAAPRGPDLRADAAMTARDDAALVARASGLARIAGRPPVDAATARVILGLG